MSIEYRGEGKFRFRVQKDGISYTQNCFYDKPISEKDLQDKKYPKTVTDKHKKFEVDIMREKVGYNENMKFSELAQVVLDEYVRPNLRANSQKLYITLVNNHLLPAFGDMKLSKIKSLHIQKMFNEKVKDYSPHTIRGIYRELNKMLNKAVEWDLIINNPCRNIKLPKATATNYRELLSKDNIIKLINAISEQPPIYKVMFSIALYAGLREGEILGLHIDDIKEQSIRVNKQYVYTYKDGKTAKAISDTKSENSVREAYIPDFLYKLIKDYINNMKIISKDGILFYNKKTNRPYTRKIITEKFDAMLKEYGIPDIRFHDTRHLYATMSINSGASIVSVAKNMGDTVETVLKNYTHGINDEQQKAAQELEKYIENL